MARFAPRAAQVPAGFQREYVPPTLDPNARRTTLNSRESPAGRPSERKPFVAARPSRSCLMHTELCILTLIPGLTLFVCRLAAEPSTLPGFGPAPPANPLKVPFACGLPSRAPVLPHARSTRGCLLVVCATRGARADPPPAPPVRVRS